MAVVKVVDVVAVTHARVPACLAVLMLVAREADCGRRPGCHADGT
jgi:hypothetical protein